MTTSISQALETLNQSVIDCRLCPRLVEHRERMALEKRARYRDQEYWGRPLPSFGDPEARVLIIGLAPAAHGGNRTGRMFTGDSSGTGSSRPSTSSVSPPHHRPRAATTASC